MGFVLQACPVRQGLEQRCAALVEQLSKSIARLVPAAGVDHVKFVAVQRQCREIKAKLLQSRHDLRIHRAAHGC